MRIGIKATQIVDGGGRKHLEKILEYYPYADGVTLVVFLSELQRHFTLPERRDIEYRFFEKPGKGLAKRVLFEQLTLRKIIREEQIDLLFEPGNLGMLSRKVPRVMLIHNLAPFSKDFISHEPWRSRIRLHLLRLLTRLSCKRARGVIHLTNFARDYVRDYLGIQNVPQRVIYMGNDDPSSEAIGKEELLNRFGVSGKLLFCCSHFYRYKNILELVHGFAQLAAEMEDELSLVVAGEHYDREYIDEIRAATRRLGVSDRVFLPGNLDPALLAGLYASCDLFVFPSTLESASLILLEAMKAGAPIAAADNSLCREVLQGAGEFFEANDPSSIAEVMKSAMHNAESLRKRSTRRAEDFAWTRTASETNGFIGDILTAYQKHGRRRLSFRRRNHCVVNRMTQTSRESQVKEKVN